MTTAILVLLGALVPFLIKLYWQRNAQKNDPLEQNRERYEQLDADLAARNPGSATANASADLDELERLRDARDQRGPDGGAGAGQ